MTICFFWIPLIELIYGICFVFVLLFNLIVDYWWVILLTIVMCVLFVKISSSKQKRSKCK